MDALKKDLAFEEALECTEEIPEMQRNCGLKPCEVPEPKMNKSKINETNKFGVWITEEWSEVIFYL